MKVRIVILSLLIFCFSSAYSIELQRTDTLHQHSDTGYIQPFQTDSLYFSSDFSFVPAEVMYNYNWNNSNIRYQTEILPGKTDTVTIPLIGPDDNCFETPFQGKVISGFRTPRRKNHTGTDIKLRKGDTIACAFDGKVRLARTFSGYGLLVLVRHNNGLETIYSHLSKILVKENQTIYAGDVVGLGGRTGRATTDHLHFESRLFGIPFNSEKYIDFQNAELLADTLYYLNGRVALCLSDFKEQAPAQQLITSATEGEAFVHKVQKGDTLSAIARKYNTSVSRICENNNITAKKILKIGEPLVIR